VLAAEARKAGSASEDISVVLVYVLFNLTKNIKMF